MLKRYTDAKPVEMMPGVTRRTLSYGERILMVEITMEESAVVPLHSHPYEQIGTLISGRLFLGTGDQEQEAEKGDTWLFPSGVPHTARALTRSVMVEAFSPGREDYKD